MMPSANSSDVHRVNSHVTAEVTCGLCGSEDYKLLFRKHGFSYAQCRSCGLVYVREQLSDHEVRGIYARGYNSKRNVKAEPRDFSSYGYLLQELDRYRASNRLLDVGCFTGKFLYGAKVNGWDVTGVEISEQAVAFCRSQLGLCKVHCTTFENASELEENYDVISMIDVIEHLRSPSSAAVKAYQLLRPGGLLYIETPNYNSLARRIYGPKWRVFFPWHFFYFTPQTLAFLLKKAGFDQVKIYTTQVGPLSSFDPYTSLVKGGGISDSQGMISKLKRRSVVRDNYKLVKSLFIQSRMIERVTFKLLGLFGLKFGGKLIAYGNK